MADTLKGHENLIGLSVSGGPAAMDAIFISNALYRRENPSTIVVGNDLPIIVADLLVRAGTDHDLEDQTAQGEEICLNESRGLGRQLLPVLFRDQRKHVADARAGKVTEPEREVIRQQEVAGADVAVDHGVAVNKLHCTDSISKSGVLGCIIHMRVVLADVVTEIAIAHIGEADAILGYVEAVENVPVLGKGLINLFLSLHTHGGKRLILSHRQSSLFAAFTQIMVQRAFEDFGIIARIAEDYARGPECNHRSLDTFGVYYYWITHGLIHIGKTDG
ncbi:hypothetical protein BO86DRAFT_395441 [Aspergillus japonicus CBS 114.51]|uniref:Uncharacterized protein n=1 Tax=Aspergillus japonicus CBS 114.51 TaxID=1448312 RepID=A0A8T8XCZ8_ASPJA|nr:hypothetical protein BO86DRAFT_395441 [Aspergillus japonicus CBS 114.51]RAH85995.1 hypothetical protein BO86DRAFT_395441 [Aspergillus japonicus CBS 114.51]